LISSLNNEEKKIYFKFRNDLLDKKNNKNNIFIRKYYSEKFDEKNKKKFEKTKSKLLII